MTRISRGVQGTHAVSVAMPPRTLLVLANGPGADRAHDSHSVDISRGTSKEQGGAAKVVTLQVRAPVGGRRRVGVCAHVCGGGVV